MITDRLQGRCNTSRSMNMEAATATLRINDDLEPRRGHPPKRRGNHKKGSMTSRRKLASGSQQEASSSSRREINTAAKTVLSWLIDHEKVAENERVLYVAKREGNGGDPSQVKTEVLKEGRIKREGLKCDCCDEIMTVGEFEVHAGRLLNKPYGNILAPYRNTSLLQCQSEAWNSEAEIERRRFNQIEPRNATTDGSDDACLICADGGDLMCCERCPSTFHLSCMGMESIPQGEWLCPYCVCKCCGTGDGDLQKCLQCERKYHWHCCFQRQELDLNASASPSFCGSSCREIYENLQRLIGVKHELEGGFYWILLRRMEPDDVQFDDEHTRTVCNSKIAIAWEVLNECFKTIIDRHTRVNIVQSIVYGRGSNFTRINFRGFYTAILEKNDEIISTASIRVHGAELAEMPFIATRHAHRLRGISRTLFVALESTFYNLGIERLVIPSVQKLVEMWKEKYGFSPINDELRKKLENFNTIMFPSSVRLHKYFLDSFGSSSVATDVEEKDKNPARREFIDLNLEPLEAEDDEIARPMT